MIWRALSRQKSLPPRLQLTAIHIFPRCPHLSTSTPTPSAQPTDFLARRHREFQRRMARHWLERSAAEGDGTSSGADAQAAPTVQQPTTDENEGSRAALGQISRQAAAPNVSRAATARTRASQNQRAPRASAGAGAGGAAASNNESNRNASAAGFSIFVESEFRDGYDLEQDDDETPGPSGDGVVNTTEAQRTKENTMEPAKWTESALPQSRQQSQAQRARRRRAAAGAGAGADQGAGQLSPWREANAAAPSAPSIPIYEDEECAARKLQAAQVHSIQAIIAHGSVRRRGAVVRATRLDVAGLGRRYRQDVNPSIPRRPCERRSSVSRASSGDGGKPVASSRHLTHCSSLDAAHMSHVPAEHSRALASDAHT